MINPKELATDELYFADKHFMSVSKFKNFQKCEVLGLQPFGEPSKAMLVGSYVDAHISGTLDEFRENTPQIFLKGKTELKADFQQAVEICKFIDNDPTFKQFMSGEKQVVMTGEIAGVPIKIKIDSYSKDIAINDLKCMASVTDRHGNYIDFITPWGYDLQMAVYQEIVKQNTGEQLLTYICAVTKETPTNSIIVNIPQNFLDRALYNFESAVSRYYDIMQGKTEPVGCGVCSACVSQRKSTQIISLEDIINGGVY